MEIEEIIAALCAMAIQQAEERGYQRAMAIVEGKEHYAKRVVEIERKLTFPSTFEMTLDHIGWLIAGHKDAYIAGGHWNLRVPMNIPAFTQTSGTSIWMGGEGYNMLHTKEE
jgi:hypothetical protein